MRKPNIFSHMMRWGLLSGTVLALLYSIVVVQVIFDFNIFFLEGWLLLLCILFGGIPGVIIGFLNAVAQYHFQRDSIEPFTLEFIQGNYRRVYFETFLFTMLVGLGMSSFSWLNSDLIEIFILDGLFPSFIAASAATYAAHRYLVRLQYYYEQGGKTKRKEKPKYDIQRLMDDEEQFNAEERRDRVSEADSRQRTKS
jgi:hypothetical protein